MLCIADQHGNLFVGKRGTTNFGVTLNTSQNHSVIGLQFSQTAKQLVGVLLNDFDIGITQRFDHQVVVAFLIA